MKTTDLNKKDWQDLIAFGIVDTENNGFANTTDAADNELQITRTPTFIRLKGKQKIFMVSYYSGCFYPLWYRVQHGLTPEQNSRVITVDKLL